MHELSLAMEICRLAQEQVGPAAVASVTAVGLEVGREAGIEVGNLEFCLEALLSSPPFGAARPVIERTAGEDFRLAWLEIDDGT